ncbi:MAG: signal peptidase I [Chlamydiales bacterium]
MDFLFFKSKPYSLSKCRSILIQGYNWYKRYRKELNSEELDQLEKSLESLDFAILRQNKEEANTLAQKIEDFLSHHRKSWFLPYFTEMTLALIIALSIAVVARQMWFELYEIPTGSMRPTYKEQDHLLVSKSAYGINIPLKTNHFYFDPSLVNRGDIVIWSGDNIDLPQTDTTFLKIFPYKKRYVKRLMGKPGDTLYFYGGKIYGIDKEENPLASSTDTEWGEHLEFIPFSNFEGRLSASPQMGGASHQFTLHHMNLPVGKVHFFSNGSTLGEVYNFKKWMIDKPHKTSEDKDRITTLSDLWGMENFGMARLLTRQQVKNLTPLDPNTLQEGALYLEIRHHPNLSQPSPQILTTSEGYSAFSLPSHTTVIPLTQDHLDTLMENMYTARFDVKEGKASRYSADTRFVNRDGPLFSNVPDGRYEFYHGKAFQIGTGGIPYELPRSHPIYNHTPEQVQKLFNLGIEFSNQYRPQSKQQVHYPSRYVYFRNGDLYALGAPLLKKEDPRLKTYIERETLREQESNSRNPYIAFIDKGPPMKNGKLDKEWIKNFGLKIPEKHYFVLGDNHAMSADSRYFGFVPEENIQGAPTMLLWPPSERWGTPSQPPRSWMTLPNLIVWTIVVTSFLLAYIIHRIRSTRPVFKKLP